MNEFTEFENNVLDNYICEIMSLKDHNSINKLYRQMRIWVRVHCYYGLGCTKETARKLNQKFKEVRRKRLDELEELE